MTRRILGVGAVIRDADGRFLLVLRGHAPQAGRWTVPGGKVEPGESLRAAVVREVAEETGLHVEVEDLAWVVDIPGDDDVVFEVHDFVATVRSGTLQAGDDAADAGWFSPPEMAGLPLTTGLIKYLTRAGFLIDEGDAMPELLPLDPDELLTTTRSVRKRLDLERPVPLDVVKEALEVALQAPTGSNSQTWHWIVLTDPEIKQKVADLYAKSFATYSANQPRRDDTARRVASSAQYLADTMAQVPVLVIGAIYSGADLPDGNQAGLWGSLLPGAWSLQLALRARGLGSAWTTLHLVYEREVAEILGIPPNVHQGVLLPVAYYTGTDFKPAGRKPLDDILHVNGW